MSSLQGKWCLEKVKTLRLGPPRQPRSTTSVARNDRREVCANIPSCGGRHYERTPLQRVNSTTTKIQNGSRATFAVDLTTNQKSSIFLYIKAIPTKRNGTPIPSQGSVIHLTLWAQVTHLTSRLGIARQSTKISSSKIFREVNLGAELVRKASEDHSLRERDCVAPAWPSPSRV